jgi:uncharacterized protein YodC (DUF2158 family)
MTEKDPHVAKVLSGNPTFEMGDVVKIRSGGPSMVVRKIEGDEIHCEWFDKSTVKSHTFLKVQLSHTTPDQIPIFTINMGGESNTPPWEREGGGAS